MRGLAAAAICGLVLATGAGAAPPGAVVRGSHLYGQYCLRCHGTNGTADASGSLATIRRIHASLPEAPVVGDIDGLSARLEKLTGVASEKADEARATGVLSRSDRLPSQPQVSTAGTPAAARTDKRPSAPPPPAAWCARTPHTPSR